MIVSIEQAQYGLLELIEKLSRGEEIIITRNEQPVARLVAPIASGAEPRVPGIARDQIAYMADDFDAPLEEFEEYSE
jgi:antitoxin (DNA-binding transcriptional repressor) of toxin-antitoxin stability system